MSLPHEVAEPAEPAGYHSEMELTCPYVGLVPYTEKEARFFFGRERETRLILDHLRAAPLTLLYGASGVGKSSLLRAGVCAAMTDGAAEKGRPERIPVYLDDWQGDVLGRLREATRRAVAEKFAGEVTWPAASTESLADWLRSSALPHRIEIEFLLDQFEEFFVYHGDREKALRDPFGQQFAEAAHRHDLPARFLVAIRDDALSRLDCFRQLFPDLTSNSLRLRPLGREAAREAIVNPVRAHNAMPPDERRYGDVEIEPSFTEEVIDQLGKIRMALGDVGEGRSEEEKKGIEPPHLQRVMTRIWRHEVETGSRTLWARTLDELGGAAAIVREHFDQTMALLEADEREICAHMFPYLVTPSGTKRASTVADLVGSTEVPAERLEALLARLADPEVRVVTPLSPNGSVQEARYEISHDYLGPAILQWRRRYFEAKTRHELAVEVARQQDLLGQQRRAAGRLRWLATGLAAVTAVVLAALLLAATKIREARTGQEAAGSDSGLSRLVEERDQARAEAARLEERLSEAESRIPRFRSMIGTYGGQLQQLEKERDEALAEARRLEGQLSEASADTDSVRKTLEELRSALGIEAANEDDPRILVQERLRQIETRRDLLFGQLADEMTTREEDREAPDLAERHQAAQGGIEALRRYLDRDPYGSFAELAERRIRNSEGTALVLKAVEHLGGSEVVDGIQSIDSRARGLYFGTRGDAAARLLVTAFGLLYLELEAPETHVVRVVHLGEGFSKVNGVLEESRTAEIQKQMLPLIENPFALLRKRQDDEFFATAVERTEIAGQTVELVEVEVGGRMYRLGIEPESGRIRSLSFTGEDEEGNPGEYQKLYSDYRLADGEVEAPFATVVRFNGETVFDLTFEVIKLDGLLDMKPLEAIEENWER